MQNEASVLENTDGENLMRTIKIAAAAHKQLETVCSDPTGIAVDRAKHLLSSYVDDLIAFRASTYLTQTERSELESSIAQYQNVIQQTQKMIEFALKYGASTSSVSSNKEEQSQDHLDMKIQWQPMHFHGEPREWLHWWDVFQSSVHTNPHYNNAVKIKCLSDCIKGEARSILGTIAFTSNNYPSIIELLLSRFNNPSTLQNIYLSELEELEMSTDARSQRQILDKILAIVRNLDSLGDKVKTDTTHVRRLIIRKFPDTILLSAIKEANRKAGGTNFQYSVEQLLEALEVEISCMEHIALNKEEQKVLVGVKTAILAANVESSPTKGGTSNKKLPTCIFCCNAHNSSICRKYATSQLRRQRIQELKRCFNCLGLNHTAKDCRLSPFKCKRCATVGHNSVLCAKRQGDNREKNVSSGKKGTNTKRSIRVRGMLDTGSKLSYIEESIVEKLNLHVVQNNVKLHCYRFMDKDPQMINSAQVLITLQNQEMSCRSYSVLCTPSILGDVVASPPKSVLDSLPSQLSYADENLFSSKSGPIQLLVGSDFYYDLVDVFCSFHTPSGILLLKSFFGWIPAGSVTTSNQVEMSTSSLAINIANGSSSGTVGTIESNFSLLNGMVDSESKEITNKHKESAYPLSVNEENDFSSLDKLWNLEVLGIETPNKFKESELVLQYFKQTTFISSDNRYVVRFPWKDTRTHLPSNFRMALARLRSLLKNSTTNLLEAGKALLQTQLEAGIIEYAVPVGDKLCQLSLNRGDEVKRLHYLPHRWIYQKDKLRIVYDASAKTKTGISLNQLIHQGPKLTENLVGLIINFRLNPIALSADIEKAYLQISLNEVDRDATRFLWVKDHSKPATLDNLVYFRFARVPFGINASPFLLNMVLQDWLAKPPINKYTRVSQHKFYVDNFITSVQNSAEALELYNVITNKLGSINMRLRDWVTNEPQVRRVIPKDLLWSSDDSSVLASELTSVLGLNWNPSTDQLFCKLNTKLPLVATKQNVLRFLASIYDPLGLFAPCLLDLKVFIQNCWKNKYQWHKELPLQLQTEWTRLRNDVLSISQIPITRHYWEMSEMHNFEMHIFCDASQKAYACCAYLVASSTVTQMIMSQLIYAKSRLAPKKMLTIPRLELMAVLIGTRASQFLVNSMDITLKRVVLWTDATTVLQWLNSTEVLQPFVQNRVNEIRQASGLSIRYVPTEDNPADHASRGKTPALLSTLSLWWKGPVWLGHESLWPQIPLNVNVFEIPQTSLAIHVLAINSKVIAPLLTDNIEKNFSSWNAQVRILRNVIKFCFVKGKLPFQASDVESFNLAEKLLIVELQRKYFQKEYNILVKGAKPLTNLDLFLDQHKIIRCKGRLAYAKFPYEILHPILLPRDSIATTNYIRKIHVENGHVGVSHVLALFRQRFWITKGRSKVKSVLHHCRDCRKWEGGSYQLPPTPSLPDVRVADVASFLYVGIDYFGPLKCRNSSHTAVEMYVLLFACLVTRAVHLELVPDMSGKHCYLALVRFTSLRRVPHVIISDNYSTFTFIQPLVGIKVNIRDYQLNQFVTTNRISWYFIPQYAPWYGGAYERLVGLVKRSLKKSYGMQLLHYEEMRTAIAHIADIVNSRPLTYMSSDEPIQALTPNHFLKLGSTNVNTELCLASHLPLSDTGSTLIQDWYHVRRVLDAYWEAFRNLYLLSLREIHLVKHPTKKGSVSNTPKIGDVVLVQEPSAPRATWHMGRILKLDSRQALATVRCQGQNVLRSIRHLYPLEITSSPQSQSLTATLAPAEPQQGSSSANE